MIKKIIKTIAIIGVSVYLLLSLALLFWQEKMLFHPNKLESDYQYQFSGDFKEMNYQTEDGTSINAVLFKAKESKGLIFYLHGNRGSIAAYVHEAEFYTSLNYDIFMLDYRGFGKSGNEISNEQDMYADIQQAYDLMTQQYDEANIVVMGYSIGTGLASNLAKNNKPKQLILKAPYYSLNDMLKTYYPWAPTSVLKYHFNNDINIPQCTMPVAIFHGDKDQVIYYGSTLKLKPLLAPKDTCITLIGQKHHGITKNPRYAESIQLILK